MPPVSPCGRVVDFVRSCSQGFWRFFPSRPDLLTQGYLYFTDPDVPTIAGPHSFGSAGWNKDGMVYPIYPTGQYMPAGSSYYDGEAPEPLPPPTAQVGRTEAFNADLEYPPPDQRPQVRNGFDARCFLVGGVDLDLDQFFRPDVTDCCWQRVLARMLELLSDGTPASLVRFQNAVALLWGNQFTVQIVSLDTTVNRFAWIDGPDFQVILRVGTQSWNELWVEVWHGLSTARDFGLWATSSDWFAESSAMVDALTILGWNPDKPITFAGHSKGAAVLWILARRLTDFQVNRDVHVLTFATPKVGDRRLIRSGSIRAARHVVHRQDIVPALPPPAPVWPLLHDVASLANIDAFRSWELFPIYQITGDGAGQPLGQPDTLPAQTYAAYIQLLRQLRIPNPVVQHWLASYVAALAECCNAPHFPFTDALWALLFGLPDNGDGGGMWGGVGVKHWERGGAGLALGGGGITPYAGLGGLALGGEGVQGPYLGSGGLEVGGAGSYSHVGSGGLKVGGAGIQPPSILMEGSGFVLKEDGSHILLE